MLILSNCYQLSDLADHLFIKVLLSKQTEDDCGKNNIKIAHLARNRGLGYFCAGPLFVPEEKRFPKLRHEGITLNLE